MISIILYALSPSLCWPIHTNNMPYSIHHYKSLGWGLLQQFPILWYFPDFHYCHNIGNLLNVMFINELCSHSSAEVTPVKYESVIKEPNGYFCKLKDCINGEINEPTDGGYPPPPPPPPPPLPLPTTPTPTHPNPTHPIPSHKRG